jgi:uncharacterized protein
MKRILLLLAFATVAINFIYCQNVKKTDFEFPNPIGFVNDYEKVFTSEQIDSLTAIVNKHQNETTNSIVIITIDSYAPYETLFDYSLDLFNTWGIGTKEKNNGVAIVFGKKIREIRIMVGYGLEKNLSNEEAEKIIDDTIIPEFKKGNFYEGIKNGLFGIIEEIK